MAHPLIVNDFQQEYTLYFAECLRRARLLCYLLFLLCIQFLDLFCHFIDQTFCRIAFIIILVHGQWLNRCDWKQCTVQQQKIPLCRCLTFINNIIDLRFNNISDHTDNLIMHALALQDTAALFIDQFSLLIVNLVIFQQVLTNSKVVGLDLLLCLLNSIGKHLVFNRHTIFMRQCIEHLHHLVRTKQTHQIIFKGNEESCITRISLSSGTASKLIINSS